MTRSALVGYTGFVGSNLAAQHKFDALYNSRNIEDIAGLTFDVLVFAGAQSKKWWANANPEEDRDGIRLAIDALSSVKAESVVLISTIDVIPSGERFKGELADCDVEAMEPYGRNRRYLERFFEERFAGAVVARLSGLFGPGLKKNVIYDLLHDNLLEKINPESAFQYYDTTRLWDDLSIAMREKLRLVHLFPEPVATHTILTRFFPEKDVGRAPSPAAHYDYRTRHGRLFGGTDDYIESSESVLTRLARFTAAETARARP